MIICLKFSLLILIVSKIDCFIPSEVLNYVLERISAQGKIDIGEVSPTLVHEVILRRGIIASLTQFFIDNPRPESKVSYNKLPIYYQDILSLYYDYYGVWICNPKLSVILSTILEPNVAVVDFSPSTKNLPYAHFDAETFINSNQRVINFTTDIYTAISSKDYNRARVLAGQISHTIQDFYSHSNWVESGHTNINFDIGKPNLNNSPVATLADNVTCVSNCTLYNATCSPFFVGLSFFLQLINFHKFNFACPIQYFVCQGNIVLLDKLVSGYYSEQSLEDGTAVPKPEPSLKCSHGGILDAYQYEPATGGINKDAGYYIFSPHATLHLKAADLAVNHTQYFFNQIRAQIGDDEFNKFLLIYASSTQLENAKGFTRQLCSTSDLAFSYSIIIFALLFAYSIIY